MTNRSEQLTELLNYLDQSLKDHRYHFDNVHLKDKEKQDFLHALELEELSYHEGARLAIKISKSRRERRDSKDAVEVLEPLVEYLESKDGARSLNQLKHVLGKMRQKEKNQQTRTYNKRVED